MKRKLFCIALMAFIGSMCFKMDNKEKKTERFYRSFLTYTENLFDGFTARNELDFQSIQEMIKKTCEFVRRDRNRIVYVMQTAKQNENLHVSHAARSCIIAIIIGIYLKLPRHQLIELGVAGLLCNISVLNMSGRIYTSREGGPNLLKSGTDMEKKLLYVHPIHAHKTLKSFNFPLSVCEAVLQHHELEDGSGFPQQIKGNHIGLYGKILVVAGFYEAFSLEHVDGVKCGHNGIVQILKNGGSFDMSVVRALVNSISIYPVGIYVLLSNGEYGQVVETVRENPRFHFVEKVKGKLVRTTDELFIVRPLTNKEIEDFAQQNKGLLRK
jgi:HD-GYP domain-containing protein (c-di-GMP phosphodiesterase class II)